MRISLCPGGEKCTYQRSFMAAAFAVVAVTFMSLIGVPGTRTQAQTPQSPCPQSSAPAPTVTNEELVSGPATMGFIDGRYRYFAFDGFASANGAPSITLVGRAYEALMTRSSAYPRRPSR